MLQTKKSAVLVVIAAIFLAAIPAFSQSSNANWAGQVQCQLNDQDSNYTRQETQTWVLAGGGPISPTGMPAYNATWTATGQGQLQKVVGGQTINIQWTTNVPATTANINIFVRASDNRLIIKPWHAQLSVFNAVKGTRQVIVNGVAQPPTSFSNTAWEWQFPRIEDSGTATNVSGTSQSQADAGSAELIHHLGALPPNATCQWQLTQGPIGPTPTPTPTPPSIQAPVTNVNASAGDGSASVTWTAPAGASPAGYSVTATPMGLRMNAAASPVTFSGLTNGTSYTFQVVAINALGQQSVPATSNPVTPMSATPLIPVGVLAAPDHVLFDQTIVLSATQSHETGGQLTKYCFYVVGTPANLTPTDVSSIDDGGCGADPTRTIRAMPQPGPYAFSLYVYDQSGTASAEVRASVTVDAAPASASSPTSTATLVPLASAGTIKTPVQVSQTHPSAPTGFTVKPLDKGAVQFSWQAVTNAKQYRLTGPGIASAGVLVSAPGTNATVQNIPLGAGTWTITTVYANTPANVNLSATATAIVRYAPAHTPPWLTKPNGAGNPGLTLSHYISLCPQCLPGTSFSAVILALGLPAQLLDLDICHVNCGQVTWFDQSAARYTNVTEFSNSQRVTRCWTAIPGARIICYSKTLDHGLQVIVKQPEFTWFLSFTAPDPSAEVLDWNAAALEEQDSFFGTYKPPSSAAYSSRYTLANSVTIDSEGTKFAPHACLSCHGGQFSAGKVTNATLLPLDTGLLQGFATTSDMANNFLGVNRIVVEAFPSAAVARYINGLYGTDPHIATGWANAAYVPSGWSDQASFYKTAIKPHCTMCHLATPSNLDFTAPANFQSNRTQIYTDICSTHSMPHAEAPFIEFFTKDTGSIYLPAYVTASLGFTSCP